MVDVFSRKQHEFQPMLFELLTPEWQFRLRDLQSSFLQLEQTLLMSGEYLPRSENIFRALSLPISTAKVVILGQDPYPNPDFACGLAFSVPEGCQKIPASLRNIVREVESDLGRSMPKGGDLSSWEGQGVVLLNRTLTTSVWRSDAHRSIGWEPITRRVMQVFAENGALGILWGKQAASLSQLFIEGDYLTSAHPSPLSAHRGFFGSKPFSWANNRLIEQGKSPIAWTAQD